MARTGNATHSAAVAPATPGSDAARAIRSGYARLATRPLHVLAFLLPLIAAYEIGTWVWLSDPATGAVDTIKAHSVLLGLFQSFGLGARSMPAVVLVTVLLVWHVLLGDRWSVRPSVLAGMAAEAAAWTLPLLILAILIQRSAEDVSPMAAAASPVTHLLSMPWQARLTVSIGAGVYEEMLFRFVLIAAVHLVLVDLCRLSDATGRVLGVIVSAGAFVLYHDAGAGSLPATAAALYLAAGVYFGVLFLARGLGICAAVHALYDVTVLVVLPESASGSV